MSWTSFMLGFVAGSVLFDILWRITMCLSQKLIVEQREHINLLRRHLGLDDSYRARDGIGDG